MSWKSVALGEVANVGAGNSAPQDEKLFENGTHNFYRTSDVGRIRYGVISDALDKLNVEGVKGLRLHPKGTILFPKSGASTFLNHRVMLEKEGYVSSHLATIKAIPEKADDKFLLYFLSTVDAKNLVQDSNYPSLKTSVIDKVIIELPPLATQKKIVAKLDAIFAEIDKAKEAAKANVNNAEALFQSYLTQVFELAGEEWQTNHLGKITKFVDYRGKTPTKTDSGIRLITAKNVKFGYLNKEPYEYIAEEDYVGWMTRGIPEKGDVLFTTEAPLANVAQLDTDEKVVFAQRLIILQSKKDVLDSEFLKFSLLSRKVQNEIISKGTGATVKGIKASLLKLIPIDYPSLNEQRKICSKLSILESESKKVKCIYLSKISNLSLYKKSILKKAFTGDLVKE